MDSQNIPQELQEDDLNQVSGGAHRPDISRPDMNVTCKKCNATTRHPYGEKPSICDNCGASGFIYEPVDNDQGYC